MLSNLLLIHSGVSALLNAVGLKSTIFQYVKHKVWPHINKQKRINKQKLFIIICTWASFQFFTRTKVPKKAFNSLQETVPILIFYKNLRFVWKLYHVNVNIGLESFHSMIFFWFKIQISHQFPITCFGSICLLHGCLMDIIECSWAHFTFRFNNNNQISQSSELDEKGSWSESKFSKINMALTKIKMMVVIIIRFVLDLL